MTKYGQNTRDGDDDAEQPTNTTTTFGQGTWDANDQTRQTPWNAPKP